MLIRIEKHFKLEQAARKKAEEMLLSVTASEAAARAELEDTRQKLGVGDSALELERAVVKRVSARA